MEHMSNIFSTSFGINFAKLTGVWLALISLTLKSTAYFFLSHPVHRLIHNCCRYRAAVVTITAHKRVCMCRMYSYIWLCERYLQWEELQMRLSGTLHRTRLWKYVPYIGVNATGDAGAPGTKCLISVEVRHNTDRQRVSGWPGWVSETAVPVEASLHVADWRCQWS